MLLPRRSCADMSAPQSKERQDSNPVPGDAVAKRRGHKRGSSARRVLRASGERRVKAAGGAHRQPRFSIALARFNDRRAWARKELRTAPREPIDRKPDPFAHGGIASSQPIAHARKRA
jgi:hypothetical protein